MKPKPYYTPEEWLARDMARERERILNIKNPQPARDADAYLRDRLDEARAEFLLFVMYNSELRLKELPNRYGKSFEWCWDKLHLHKLDTLGQHLVTEGMMSPINGMILAALPKAEQTAFMTRALRLTWIDFRIAVFEHIRKTVWMTKIPLLTQEEVAGDAIVAVNKLKAEVACLKRSLDSVTEYSGRLRQALYPSRDSDDW